MFRRRRGCTMYCKHSRGAQALALPCRSRTREELLSCSCPAHVLESCSCLSMSCSCPAHVLLVSYSCPVHVLLVSCSCSAPVLLMSPVCVCSCPAPVLLVSCLCPAPVLPALPRALMATFAEMFCPSPESNSTPLTLIQAT